jgi:hypothetical protein
MEEEKNKTQEGDEKKEHTENEEKKDLESSEQADEFVLEDHLKSEEEEEKRKRRKRIDLAIEWALIFILGILVGIAVKTEAKKTITVGFNDHKMKIFSQDFNINQLQKELADKAKAAPEEQSQAVPEHPSDGTAPEPVQPDAQIQAESQAPQN